MGPAGFTLTLALLAAAYASPIEENSPGTLQSGDSVDHVPQKSNRTETGDRPPAFVKKMNKTIVKPAGNTVALKCKATGNPAPNITWYKNNGPPKRSLGDNKYNNWGLTMEDAVTDDSGNYTCVVCNYLACINFTYKVDVVGK